MGSGQHGFKGEFKVVTDQIGEADEITEEETVVEQIGGAAAE